VELQGLEKLLATVEFTSAPLVYQASAESMSEERVESDEFGFCYIFCERSDA